jgi:hypothetical protein
VTPPAIYGSCKQADLSMISPPSGIFRDIRVGKILIEANGVG